MLPSLPRKRREGRYHTASAGARNGDAVIRKSVINALAFWKEPNSHFPSGLHL